MASVTLNPVLERIQGKVGDLVFKCYKGRDIVSKMPDRTGIVPTIAQEAQMEKFRLATIYGKAVMADPEAKLVYEKAGAQKGVPAFAVSVGDFLNAPAVGEVNFAAYAGKIGDKIQVRATDDVEVSGVTVAVRAEDGAVLEQGAAVWTENTGYWTYTATTNLEVGQAAVIEVNATDRTGHIGSKAQSMT